jgi:two-component system, NtrC family, sensor kinase
VIAIYRQEVRPFTAKQIELMTNFASQAVIAIENARLLNELRQRTDDLAESLEQQTATSDVLRVISSSPGELTPVFETMLANATRLCAAKFGFLHLYENGEFRIGARHNQPAAFAQDAAQRGPLHPGPLHPLVRVAATKQLLHIIGIMLDPGAEIPAVRALKSRQVVHVADLREDRAYREGNPVAVAGADSAGMRTLLAVPMFKENEPVGAIVIYRREVRPFTEKQIELVTNFANQAVIAIENTRLLNELRESLQQQTATADVLKVISRSTFDLQTVLDALVESATKLCEADLANIARPKGDGSFRQEATYGFSPALKEYLERTPIKAGRESAAGRALLERAPIHI